MSVMELEAKRMFASGERSGTEGVSHGLPNSHFHATQGCLTVNGHEGGLHLEEPGFCISNKMLSPSMDKVVSREPTVPSAFSSVVV